MILLTEDRLAEVLAYMEDDLPNCLYLYGDIVRYGLNDPNMTAWLSERDGKITAVIMKYFTGSHVYSKDLDFDIDEMIEKIKEIKVDRLSSQREVVETIAPLLQEDYYAEYGGIIRYNKGYKRTRCPVAIERAKTVDASAIADFLRSDEKFTRYRRESLIQQLTSLIETGIGRSYIIRENGEIVAHSSINLETDTYVITGLTFVKKDYRSKFYGIFIESFVINDLHQDGKEMYGMTLEGKRLDGMVKMGNELVAHYGRLSLRRLQEE